MRNKIKKIREKLNITQEELARKINVTNKTMYNIETKNMDTKISTAFRIKKELKQKKIEDIWEE